MRTKNLKVIAITIVNSAGLTAIVRFGLEMEIPAKGSHFVEVSGPLCNAFIVS